MEKALAETIQMALENDGVYESEIYENYSGRGMFGETTTGIITDNISSVISAVISHAYLFVREGDGDRAVVESIFDIQNIRWDNMGTQIIIY